MADIRPFAAVMPPPSQAKAVADPPYDVVNTEEARRLATDNPLGFMRVSRAEIEWPGDVDPYSAEVYAKARENYQRLRQAVPLRQDDVAGFYLYALEMAGHRQVGIVAAAAVDDYDRGVIKKHEKTRENKEDDRTRHILALRSQTGPVFLTYRGTTAIHATVEETVRQQEALFDFVADDGVRHSGWRVPASLTASLRGAFADIPSLYIADGHHRAAGASRARAELKAASQEACETQECDGFLAVIFPASQLQILPYNRVVDSLNGRSPEAFLQSVGATPFTVYPDATASPEHPGSIHMYLSGRWFGLHWRESTADLSPADQLDVSLLQNHILGPLLGIDDPRTSPQIDFIGGIRGTSELEKRVDSSHAAVAFSLYPTTIDQLMAISDAGQVMPPKSTWFEPKLRDGLFIHEI